MVSQLFYTLSVSVGLQDSATLEIASDLPYPSPVGTERLLECEDEHLDRRCSRGATVHLYEHKVRHEWQHKTADLSALFMILAPPEDDGQLEYYVVKQECWAEFRQQMEDNGWSVVELSNGLPREPQDE